MTHTRNPRPAPTRLTLRRLRAMEAALNAMLAGAEGEGDWPQDIPAADAEAALNWIWEQIEKREAA